MLITVENYLPYVPKFSFNLGANYLVEVNKNWLGKYSV
jgi:hypothetical protein